MDETLRVLRAASSPPTGAEAALWSRVSSRITAPVVLLSLSSQLSPDSRVSVYLWQKVLRRITCPEVSSLLTQVRDVLVDARAPTPSLASAFIAHRRSPFQWMKWAAACAVVALVIKSSPLLFFASSTIADSTVILLPTRGTVEVRTGDDMWEQVQGERVLSGPTRIRTSDGEATVVLHDDGVLRLAPDTEILLRDVLDRPQTVGAPTVLLESGQMWVQGLVPATLGAVTISTLFGDIRVHEGSVDIRAYTLIDVAVWDRHATVERGEDFMAIHAGDRVQLWSKNIPSVHRIAAREYVGAWVSQNLDRDAVHRREIAELQRERRAAVAGILPTSPLYTVKRAAETVDIFLTFDDAERIRKQFSYAENRLNEAAALLTEGEDATRSLGEYQEALLQVANGPGGEALLQEQMAESVADLIAVLPDDDGYVLKQAVLLVQGFDVQEVFLLDSLALLRDLALDDPVRARGALDAVRERLALLQPRENIIPLPVRTEALSLLSQVVLLLSADPERTKEEQDLLNDVLAYVPAPVLSARALLSDEEVAHLSAEIHARVFATYKMPKSRLNQLVAELRHFRGHPDEGRILRRVYRDFPEGSELTRYVRSTMQNLRVQRIGDRGDVRL